MIFEKELLVTSDTVLGVSISKIRDTGVLLNATSLNTALTFEKPVQVSLGYGRTCLNGQGLPFNRRHFSEHPR